MSIVKSSYGIILTKTNNNKIYYLLVQKRATYYFNEFIHGHYNKTDDKQILFLLNRMSNDEKDALYSLNFGNLWYRIWLVNPDFNETPNFLKLEHEYLDRYHRCKNYFNKNFVISDRGRRLRELLNKTNRSDILWEIPKGRKKGDECPINCAIREFAEETGLKNADDQYELLTIEPIKMSNTYAKYKYNSYYYIAHTKRNIPFRINYNNPEQLSEIIGIKWYNMQEIKLLNETLHNFLIPINKRLVKDYKLLKH